MGRMLSIDYGARRTGLATTDREQRIATGLCTLPTEEVLPFLRNYVQQEQVEGFVLGDPMSLSGGESDASAGVQRIANALRSAFPKLSLYWVDERFSSQEASRALRAAGLPKKKRSCKSAIDRTAAVLILQTYLARRL